MCTEEKETHYEKIKTEEKEWFLAQNGYSSEGLKVIRECGLNIEQVVREEKEKGQDNGWKAR